MNVYGYENVKHVPIHQISTDNGLSHTIINSIYRDEFGFAWIGTIDGLNRYDGHSITTFRYDREDPYSIKANFISEVCGDKNGHIYIRGQHCLISFDMRTERFHTIHESGINAITWHDALYYATNNAVFRINNESDEECIYQHLEPEYISSIQNICFDSAGNLTLLTSSDEVIRISGNGKRLRHSFSQLYDLNPDEYGNIWVSTRTSGFHKIDRNGECTSYTFKGTSQKILDRNNVRAVIHAYGSKYYVGTYDGLLLFDTVTGDVTSVTYDLQKGFDNRAVRTLYYDNGILFIGTYHAGFQYFNTKEDFQQTFYPAARQNAISSPIISSVCKDRRNVLWIGSISGGLTIMDPDNKIRHDLRNRIESCKVLNNIKNLHYDYIEDILWVATFSEGVVKIDFGRNSLQEISPYHKSGESPIQNIVRILPYDSRHLLLCSTIDGIFSLDTESLKMTSLKPIYGAAGFGIINDIAVNGDILWMCYDNSVVQVDLARQEIVQTYPTCDFPDMLAEHRTTRIFCSKNGDIWVGTSGAGLFRYDKTGDRFICCRTDNSKDNGFINDICEGFLSDDLLYLATNDGISIYSISTGHVKAINRNSNLPLTITDFIYTYPDSTLYCSGMQGLYASKEETLSDTRSNRHDLFITGIWIDNSRVVPDDSESALLHSSTLFQKSVTLRHSVSSVAFEIANSGLEPSDNLSFEYMLKGYDSEFLKPYSNTISYTNLVPGRYTLYIRPSGAEEYTQEMSLRILPPIYARWWFILALFIITGIILYVVIMHYENRRKLNIKLKEAERDREVTQAKVEFFANISHEFRTPLTLIHSYLELMLQTPNISPESYRYINGAMANTAKLKDMTNEFINASKSDGQLHLSLTYSPVESFVNEYYAVFYDYAMQKDITLVFDSRIGSEVTIAFDRIHIGRALSNLISNAFKYTRGGGKIRLEITQDNEFVHICVEDNGIGIKENDLDNVFLRFWQDKQANEGLITKGSGIGLAYVKTILDMHNGKVSVSSTPDVSTRFTISLPKSNHMIGYIPPFSFIHDADEITDTTHIDTEFTKNHDYSILIAEDNSELRQLLRRIFAPHYKVTLASDGAEALHIIEHDQPDLIVSDVMMPNMSGIELCNILKAQPQTSHIPVVLLTALNAEGSIIKGLNTGADDYVTKPFSARILLARCYNILHIRKQLQEKYQNSADSAVDILTDSQIDNEILQKAVQIIEANISAPAFDITDFAQELGLSRTSLFNKIKSLTGMTPNNFIIDIKLKHAATSLRKHPDGNISTIAYACGFNTLSHFNKLFKKTYGITPTQYRNKK